eukprot:gene12119-16225_t
MKSCQPKFLFLLCLSLLLAAQATIPLMPIAASIQISSNDQILSLDSQFYFNSNINNNALLQRGIVRYEKLIAASKYTSNEKGDIKFCDINISSLQDNDYSVINADESYSLSIDISGTCEIAASTLWGALRGMETFSQLLTRESSGTVQLHNAPLSILDLPRFSHRGILIDTSRHYLPVKTIQRIIESLPTNKFNVLHWHAVDAESFPLDTPSAPTMIEGAYTPKMKYTMDELSMLKEFARDRAVEIIFEIDVPGHAASWAKGKLSIMADCFEKYSYNINDFALNPTLNETYEVLNEVLSDVVKSTKSKYVHIGGDEVVYGCWKEDAGITKFMTDNSISSYDQLLAYFVTRADAIVADLGATVIHWEEVFTAGCKVQETTLFQVWTDSSKVAALTAAGHKVIASPSNYWYLNIAANTWQVVYGYDPIMNITSQSQQSLIIGGEVALWGEYVDETNIESSIYPRASAGAERLWSPSTVTDLTDAKNRLNIQRCRMVSRGFYASPVQPGYCDVTYV